MTRFRKRTVACLGALVILGLIQAGSGCGDGDEGTDGGTGPGNGAGGTVIGPAGGTAASADSHAVLVVPAGALSEDVTLTIASAPSPPAGAVSGTAYDFGPTGTAFAVPATLSLEYDPVNLPAGTAPAALRLSRAQSGTWTPLADSAVDSIAFKLSATTVHLSTYGITTGAAAGDSSIAYLKDDPTPGAENEFDSLSAALAWLSSALGSEDLGIIVWQTSTAQSVTTLAFLFDLRIDVESGYTAILEGPPSDPLVIDAGGAVELSEFEILAPGGLVLNANRNVSIGGCTLPDLTTVNIGGVAGAPFPAANPAYLARSAAASLRAKGATIFANQFGQDLNVNLTGSGTLQGNYTLENNSGERLTVGGSAVLGGTSVLDICTTPAAPSPIPIAYPTVGSAFTGDAQLKMRGLKQVQILTINSRMEGLNTLRMEKIEGNSAAVSCQGAGTLMFFAPSMKVDILSATIGVTGAQIQVDSLEASTVTLASSGAGVRELSNFQFQLREAEISTQLEVNLMTCDGPIDIDLDDCDLQDCWLNVPEGADVSLGISDGSIEGILHLGPEFKCASAGGTRSGRGAVNIHGLTWSGSGTDHVDLDRLSGSVSITECTFSYTGDPALAVGLTEIGGSILVSDNSFANLGLGLVDCTGSATVQGNTVNLSASTGYGVSVGNSASTSIADCTLNCAGGANAIQTGDMNGSVNITGCTIVGGTAALVVGNSNVTCDGNAMVTGMISIIAGQLHFAGNTCSGVMLIDDLATPGLQNDPVPDNDGLSPNDVMTRMDWDGNGCCDYPPEWNQKVNGECVCDGVSAEAARR